MVHTIINERKHSLAIRLSKNINGHTSILISEKRSLVLNVKNVYPTLEGD